MPTLKTTARLLLLSLLTSLPVAVAQSTEAQATPNFKCLPLCAPANASASSLPHKGFWATALHIVSDYDCQPISGCLITERTVTTYYLDSAILGSRTTQTQWTQAYREHYRPPEHEREIIIFDAPK